LIRFKAIHLILILFVVLIAGNISAQYAASSKSKMHPAKGSLAQTLVNDSLSVKSNLIDKKYNPIKYDSSNVVFRSIDSAKIKSYLKEKDFKYFEDPEYTMTLWERLMEWLKRQFLKLTQYESYNTVWDIVIYILIALAVIAIIFGIYKSEIKVLFFSNKSKNGLNVTELVEDINLIDFEKMIEEAIAAKNFRYAIRLNYLRSLKILSDKEIINWKINKTNREFIKEIKSNDLKSKFEIITSDFEFIWYGGFDIDYRAYINQQNSYSDFNTSLQVIQK
jgi:hypothetical protein